MSLTSASPAPTGASLRETDPSCVGMMEGAFFVGRSELLDWLNSTLGLSLSRIEQCASGCVYLQALDCLLGPQSRVPMSKVRWGVRRDYEYVHNYKLLQAAFDAHNIHKHIEVNKLIKAKYQDNLEFLQWLKAFCDRTAPSYATDVAYDAVGRRKLGVGPFPDWAPVGPEGPPVKPAAAFAASTAAAKLASAAASAASRCRIQQQQQQRGRGDPAAAAAAAAAVETLQGELQQAVLERDFYYNKLRRIELLCGAADKDVLSVRTVLAVLYAKDEEEQPGPADVQE